MVLHLLAALFLCTNAPGFASHEACSGRSGAAGAIDRVGVEQHLSETSFTWMQASSFLIPCTLMLLSLTFRVVQEHAAAKPAVRERPLSSASRAPSHGLSIFDITLDISPKPSQPSKPSFFSSLADWLAQQGLLPASSSVAQSEPTERPADATKRLCPRPLSLRKQKKQAEKAEQAHRAEQAVRASLERAQELREKAARARRDSQEPLPEAPTLPEEWQRVDVEVLQAEQTAHEEPPPALPPVIPFQKSSQETAVVPPAPEELPQLSMRLQGAEECPRAQAGPAMSGFPDRECPAVAEISAELLRPRAGAAPASDAGPAASSGSFVNRKATEDLGVLDTLHADPRADSVGVLLNGSLGASMLLPPLHLVGIQVPLADAPGPPWLWPLTESLRESSVPSELSKDNPLVISSLGSFGHPDMCYRPCVYLAKGGCKRDVFCTHCHFDHEPTNKLGKNQKKFMEKQLDEVSVLAAVLPCLRAKAIERGLQREAMHLCVLIQSRVEDLSRNITPRPIPAELSRTMHRLSLHTLLGILIRRSDIGPEFMDRLTVGVAQFRAAVPTSLRSVGSYDVGMLLEAQAQLQ